MLAAVSFLVVAWLPGAVLFRIPLAARDRRAALPADERTFWAVVLSVAISLSLVLTGAAVHRYSFPRLLIADAGVALVLAAAARGNLRLGPMARRAGPAALVPVALTLFGAWRFLPPSEYIIGGKDPGVYLNAGVQIAQRGTLVYRDPVIAAVPVFARDLFLPRDKNRGQFLSPRFMGFFVLNPDSGAVVSQFPHVYPASIAIGYAIDGLSGARRAATFWGVFGLLAVYFLGARLLGRPAAAAGATLLAVNVVQLWFARYPNADIVMQGLLFAALLAAARAHVDDDPFFAPVAGGLLGLLLFLRFDAVVAVAAVVAGIALGYVAGHRVRWTFFVPLTAAAALCGWYLVGPMREYFELPRVFLSHLPGWQYCTLGAAAVAVLALPVLGRRSPRIAAGIVPIVPRALAATVIALAAYAFFLRHPGGKLTDYDAYALRTFASFYLTVPGLVAALIGYAIVARTAFWRDPAFVLTLTAFSLFFFFKIRIVPEHFWAARRFVPIILPGAMLLIAAAALAGTRRRSPAGRLVGAIIGLTLLALLATAYARAARPVLHHVEYQGIIAHLERLAGRVGDDDLLVVESRDAGSDVHVLALPLAYVYARNVLVLSTAAPDKTVFAAFLDQMHARYNRVLFLGGGGTDLLSSRWSVTPIDSERFGVPEYDSLWNAYPRAPRRKDFDYSVYLFGPPRAAATDTVLDVGINDDLNVIRFHAKEVTDGRTFRWSRRQSFLIVDRIEAGAHTLALWMSDGGRPAAAPPAVVEILVGARSLGSVRVVGPFREYDLAVPADIVAAAAASGEPVKLTLRTETWNPLRVIGAPDDRDLGVMVDRVAVR